MRRLFAWTDTHWGHLATKPAQSGLALLGLHLWPLQLPLGEACLLALGVPALVSLVRKVWLFGRRAGLSGAAWRDEGVDTLAAAVLIAPLALPPGTPLLARLGLAAVLALALLGAHRGALP